MLSEICLPKVFENFTEAPKTIFQQRGGACHPVASSLSNPISKMFWEGLDSNCYLHPYLDKPSEGISYGPGMKLECNRLFTHTPLC